MAASWLIRSSFKPDEDIPDLSGKVIIVTGGNVGLGLEQIKQLSKHNPKQIYLAARTESKAKDAIASLQNDVPDAAPITWLPLDLTSFSSIKTAADTFNKSSSRLDILCNNAGIMACPPGLTKEGYEIEFGTNHIGHHLLTKLLLPTLQKTAKEPGADVRIINLSSEGQAFAPKGGIVWNDLKTHMASYSTWTRYGQSKLANIHFTRSLSHKYPEIRSIAIHPGAVGTNLVSGPKASYPFIAPFVDFLSYFLVMPVSKGAWNQLWASVSPDAKSGLFYHPVGQLNKGSQYAQSAEQSEELWQWTEKELKEHGY